MKRRFSVVIGALTAVLVISVIANVLLINRAKQYYSDLNSVRLDPLGLSNFSESPTPEAGKIRVVFYGDSRGTLACTIDR